MVALQTRHRTASLTAPRGVVDGAWCVVHPRNLVIPPELPLRCPIPLFLMRLLVPLLLMNVTLVAGCSSTMQATPPANYDLNGRWRLVPEDSDLAPRRETGIDERLEDARGSPRRVTGAFNPGDFPVLVAERMVIEQDRQSMGIDYPGLGYRDITFGERQSNGWEVHAGWEEETPDLLVKMKRNRVRYQELYRLSGDGTRLTVIATLDSEQGDQIVTRVFERDSRQATPVR